MIPLYKDVNNQGISNFIERVENEMKEIGKKFIIYVSEEYTAKQLEYIETIPLVQIPRC